MMHLTQHHVFREKFLYAFIDFGLTSTTTTIVSYVVLFVIIVITTAGALKVAFDKVMEEMEKEYPNRKEDKNKNDK